MKVKFNKIALMISMISMVVICSTTIAYARFSRQYNPEVSKFGVSVASQDNMMISTSGLPGTFKDAIKLGDLVTDTSVTLTPIIGKVEKTADETYEVLNLVDEYNNPVVSSKYLSFDLYFIASSDMNLYLKGSRAGEVIVFDDTNSAHHFTVEEKNRLMTNMRVAFLTYSTAYQSSGPVYSEYSISTKVYSTTEVTSDYYSTFTDLGYSQTAKDTILATTTKNEVTKMKVVIWLEEDNLGELEAICDLSLSLRFEAVPIQN